MPLSLLGAGGLASFSLASIKYLLPFIIVSAIKFLGITLVTYVGLDLATTSISNYIINGFNSVGSDALAILTMGGFLDFFNITIAGWAAQIQLKQILGAFSKIKINTGGG